jgi:hypothetical protein
MYYKVFLAMIIINTVYGIVQLALDGWTTPQIIFLILRVLFTIYLIGRFLRNQKRSRDSAEADSPPTQPNGRPWVGGSSESEAYLRSLERPRGRSWIGGTPVSNRYGAGKSAADEDPPSGVEPRREKL